MEVKKYRKKPVVIEAIQWTGINYLEMSKFIICKFNFINNKIVISTLEGEMTASPGDYIIKGVNGEYYPCKEDIFNKTYEEVK